ncbi:MAG: neuraminidase-like domain-containing protein [Bacteroidota bacterium]
MRSYLLPADFSGSNPEHVYQLQQILSLLGYTINQDESDSRTIGYTTKEAIHLFSKSHCLSLGCEINSAFIDAINSELGVFYRIRGKVTDDTSTPVAGKLVIAYQYNNKDKTNVLLGQALSYSDGSYYILYRQPTVQSASGLIPLSEFCIFTQLYNPPFVSNSEYFTVNESSHETVIDFNISFLYSQEKTLLEIYTDKLNNAVENLDDFSGEDFSIVAKASGMSLDSLGKYLLSYRCFKSRSEPEFDLKFFFAFIYQGYPINLPENLLPGSNENHEIFYSNLISKTIVGISLLDIDLRTEIMTHAVKKRLISAGGPEDFEILLALLNTQLVILSQAIKLDEPLLVGNSSIRSLIDISGGVFTDGQKLQIAQILLDKNADLEEFSKELRLQIPNDGNNNVERVIRTFEFGKISKNHPMIINHLNGALGYPSPTRNLAANPQEYWATIIASYGENGYPSDTAGETVYEKTNNYAKEIYSNLEKLYPDVAFIARAERSGYHNLPHFNLIKNFIYSPPQNFSLFTSKIKDVFPTVGYGEEEKKQILNEAAVVQRVFQMAPNPDTAVALLDEHIHSSGHLYFVGNGNVKQRLAARNISEDDAEKVFSIATLRYSNALAAFTNLKSELNIANPRAISPAISSEIIEHLNEQFPNLETLFGSLDYCDCKQCRSVLSPSAYLVDLLTFLDGIASEESGRTVKDILFDRRPDIGEIKLNCPNTDTPMPYIDLACEILENEVTPNLGFCQTTLQAAELKAIPEHVNDVAYDKIKKSYFPMYNSFNLNQTITRTFLEKMGMNKSNLMEDFRNINAVDDAQISAEYFGMTEVDYRMVIGSPGYYFTGLDLQSKDFSNLNHRNLVWGSIGYNVSMPVMDFLKYSGLNCDQMQDLLRVKWITQGNITNPLGIDLSDESCDCDAKFVTDTEGTFDKIHRFLRLWRTTGYQMWELDLLLRNQIVSPGSQISASLEGIMRFDKIRKRLNLPFEVVLAFYGDINWEERNYNGKSEHSLFFRLFQNKTIITDPSTFDAFTPNQGQIGSISFPSVRKLLSGILSITESELKLLEDTLLPVKVPPDCNMVTIEYLSLLFRHATLAKAIGISIREITDIFAMSISDSYLAVFNSLVETERFIEWAELLKKTDLDFSVIRYLLTENFPQISSDWPALLEQYDFFNNTIEDIRKKIEPLYKKFCQHVGLYEDTVRLLLSRMPEFADASDIDHAIELIIHQGTFFADNEQKRVFLKQYFSRFLSDLADAENVLINQNNPDYVSYPYLLKHLMRYISYQYLREIDTFSNEGDIEIILNLVNGAWSSPGNSDDFLRVHFDQTMADNNEILQLSPGTFTNLDIVYRYQLLFTCLYRVQRRSCIAETVSEAFSTALEAIEETLNSTNHYGQILYRIFDYSDYLLTDNDGNFILSLNIQNTAIQRMFLCLELINKYSILIKRAKVKANLLRKLFLNILQFGPFPIFPVEYSQGGRPIYSFMNFIRINEVNNSYLTEIGYSFADFLDEINHSQLFTAQLAALFKVAESEMTGIFVSLGLSQNQNDVIIYLANSSTIQDEIELMHSSGVDSATLLNWSTWIMSDSQELQMANEVFNQYKSRFSNNQWLEILPPIQKPIREAKCKALSSYLIMYSQLTSQPQNKRWHDTNGLYGYFLIDVEMSACQLTSRIKQAISSVQLFVQRCMINLESQVTVGTNPEWAQWKWMKYYRIWEANRKVFLYPENWIVPELRDDKTPFFQDLEDELNRGEITPELAEDVFSEYLNKLHEVANMAVSGIYHEVDSVKKINKLHVIARTHSHPHTYYYRVYDGNYNVWSAWEKIDLDIKGDLVVPVVYNRKLHIFWLVINNKAKKIDAFATAPDPWPYMEIQPAWSIRKKNGWSPIKISKKKHFIIGNHKLPQLYSFIPGYNNTNNELEFNLYLKYSPKDLYDDNRIPPNTTDYPVTSIMKFNGNFYEIQSYISNDYNVRFSGPVADIFRNYDALCIMYEEITKTMDPETLPILNSWMQNCALNNPLQINNNACYFSDFSSASPGINSTPVYVKNPNNHQKLLTTTCVYPNLVFTTGDNANLISVITDGHLYHPFFYQDYYKVYFIKPEWEIAKSPSSLDYSVFPHYHPYTTLFKRELSRDGIDGLLNRKIQMSPETYSPFNNFNFTTEYQPETHVEIDNDYQTETVDFAFGGGYSIYNWEMFFHAPLYIACKLSQNQKFEEAMHWFHYIFNPTDTTSDQSPQKFWTTKPFHLLNTQAVQEQNIANILNNISQYADQVRAWLDNPFKPHLIARYRPVAYERTVVMKYIDNLIAWGDQLFRRDTMESINEATMLYILAYEILGPRPKKMPGHEMQEVTYNEIVAENYTINNGFSYLAHFEEAISYTFNTQPDNYALSGSELKRMETGDSSTGSPGHNNVIQHNNVHGTRYIKDDEPLPRIDSQHFCIPVNDMLLSYWDLVEDRLYKIRHCMNIEGVERQLPLFEPPIDPALLVQAAAAGLDLSIVLDQASVGNLNYRFRAIHAKAVEFCNEVKQLGEKLLTVLEKRDAESLTLLRSTQEINIQEAIKQVRKLQVNESEENVEALNRSVELTQEKIDYYLSREFMNSLESASYTLSATSVGLQNGVAIIQTIASILNMIPEIRVGLGFTSDLIDGSKFAGSTNLIVNGMQTAIGIIDRNSGLLSIQGGYKRRLDEWQFQAKLSKLELNQINQQILATQIRQQIAEKELENHEMQLEQLNSVDEYYKTLLSGKSLKEAEA